MDRLEILLEHEDRSLSRKVGTPLKVLKGQLCHTLSRHLLGYGNEAVLESKLRLADRYLDPFPSDIEQAFESMLDHLDSVGGQEIKIVVLRRLWQDGLLSTQNDNVLAQSDYTHRVLLFLMRLSSRMEDTMIDSQCQSVVKKFCMCASRDQTRVLDEQKVKELALLDEEDEEGQWWRRNVTYSSGDELSDWGDEAMDDDSEDDSELPRKPSKEDVSRSVAGEIEHDQEYIEERIVEPDQSEGILGHLKRVSSLSRSHGASNVYGPRSLSVLLAARSQTLQMSDLNPRYCVTERAFVDQIVLCILGCKSPGFLFSLCKEANTYSMAQGVHLDNVSVKTLEAISEDILLLANHLKLVDQVVHYLKGRIDPLSGADDMLLSFAYGLDRISKRIREKIRSKAYSKSLPTLLHVCSSMHEPCCLLCKIVCPLLSRMSENQAQDDEGEAAVVSLLLDMMQEKVDGMSLTCSSGHSAYLLSMLLELFISILIPYIGALEEWMMNGDLERAPRGFCISVADPLNDVDETITVHHCPSAFRETLDDMLSIRSVVKNQSTESRAGQPGLRLAAKALKLCQHYFNMLENGFRIDFMGDQPAKDCDFVMGEIKRINADGWWNKEWTEFVNEPDDSLRPDCSSNVRIAASSFDHVQVPMAGSFQFPDCTLIADLMKKSSWDMIKSFRTSTQCLSEYWSTGGAEKEYVSIIQRMKSNVTKKLDVLISPTSSLQTFDEHECEAPEIWPLPPSMQLSNTLGRIVSGMALSIGERALQNGLSDQLLTVKKTIILEEGIWGQFMSGILEACSTRGGLDAVSVSNLNAMLSIVLDNSLCNNIPLRKHIEAMWIECLQPDSGPIETSFTLRRTSYLRLITWNVMFCAPVSDILDLDAKESISDMRNLVLKVNWVWKTIVSARKASLKFGEGSQLPRETHAHLLIAATSLRQVMNALYAYLDTTFIQVQEEVRKSERIVQMRHRINSSLSCMSQTGTFGHGQTRVALTKWLDSSLAFGILVNRRLSSHQNDKSPEFEKAISAAQLDSLRMHNSFLAALCADDMHPRHSGVRNSIFNSINFV